MINFKYYAKLYNAELNQSRLFEIIGCRDGGMLSLYRLCFSNKAKKNNGKAD